MSFSNLQVWGKLSNLKDFLGSADLLLCYMICGTTKSDWTMNWIGFLQEKITMYSFFLNTAQWRLLRMVEWGFVNCTFLSENPTPERLQACRFSPLLWILIQATSACEYQTAEMLPSPELFVAGCGGYRLATLLANALAAVRILHANNKAYHSDGQNADTHLFYASCNCTLFLVYACKLSGHLETASLCQNSDE